MHYSGKAVRVNGNVKNHNQMPPPYNPGYNFLSAPNVSNSGQLQINRKYVNNMGNLNEVSVLQYHRTTNMQIKHNNLEMTQFQNLRQQQAFVYKTPQYHNNHMNPSLQHKLPVNHPVQRKFFKEQTIPTLPLRQPQGNMEFNSKRSKELQNLQQANKLNNKSRVMQMNLRTFPTKVTNDIEEESNLQKENVPVDNISLIRQKQVPEKIIEANENVESNKENNNRTEVQSDVEKVPGCNNEQSELIQSEAVCEKSTKLVREKTPMCLINDLARFNKISFQYRLTSENGPAHCKRFTVTLMLGDEEYTAEGLKIKEAQHLAAKEAIEKTKYKHPTPKTNRRTDDNAAKSNITPTVELNALAMKLGQQTYYIFDQQQAENNSSYGLMNQIFDTTQAISQQPTGVVENLINNGRQIQTTHQRRQFLSRYQNRYITLQNCQQNGSVPTAYTYFPPTSPCKITLIVGTKQFVGVGRTLQQAKHDAASNALKVLKEQMENEQLETQDEIMEENDNKSPISLVFEIGIKRNLPVDFKVLREEGPAHMRTFVTACIVGDIVTEGEGTGKKISKKKAAHKMLEELNKLPPLTPVASPVKRTKLKASYKKSSVDQSKQNSIENKEYVEKPSSHKNKRSYAESEVTNPINQLIEWHQNKKEKEPEFKLISDFGKENSRRRQFVMEVSSNNITVRGVGNSKKSAKHDAAQNFLNAIEENSGQLLKPTENDNTATKIDNIVEGNKNLSETTYKIGHSRTLAKQDAPQIYHRVRTESKQRSAMSTENNNIKATANISEEKNSQNPPNKETCNKLLANKETRQAQGNEEKTQTTSSSTSLSEVATKETTNTNSTSTKNQTLHMKDQLMYLAKLLGFDVEFSDYPKGNHNEFLTIVMLSTTPPQICHGVGVSANESQEDAAKNALKILSEMGLNNAVKS